MCDTPLILCFHGLIPLRLLRLEDAALQLIVLAPLPEPVDDTGLVGVIHNGCQRDRYDDAEDAEESSEEDNGYQDPDGWNAEGVAEQLGL